MTERPTLALGFALAITGTALILDGPGHLTAAGRWTYDHAGMLILVAAGLLALTAAIPPDRRAGPLILAAIGAVVLAEQEGYGPQTHWWTWAGAIVVGMGLVLGLRSRRPAPGPDPGPAPARVDPVHTYRGVIRSRTVTFEAGEPMPVYTRLLAVGSRVRLDLGAAAPGRATLAEISIACWAARSRSFCRPPGRSWPGGSTPPGASASPAGSTAPTRSPISGATRRARVCRIWPGSGPSNRPRAVVPWPSSFMFLDRPGL